MYLIFSLSTRYIISIIIYFTLRKYYIDIRIDILVKKIVHNYNKNINKFLSKKYENSTIKNDPDTDLFLIYF